VGEAARDQGTLRLVQSSDLLEEIRAFLIACQAKRLSPATVARYERELAKWRAWTEAHSCTQVQRITATDIRQYLITLEEAGHNPGGQHLAYRTIRRFLRWYDKEYEPAGWKNPISKVDAPKVPEEIKAPLNLEHLRKMLATCTTRNLVNDRDRAVLLCLLDSGCRASEFVALRVSDVDLIDGAVTVRRGKGGKDRTVILGAKSRAALGRYLRRRPGVGPNDPLFARTDEAPLTYWGLWQIVRRRAKAAKVAMPGLHAFRRTFALLSLRGGMDLESLRRILGHRDLSVIKRYLAQTKDDLRRAHEKSGPVDNLL
jgi:integrase/recombinase XerD